MPLPEFRLLGPLEVVVDGQPIAIPTGRARALLAVLCLHARRVVSTDRLIDLLWVGDPPKTARTKLHGLVSNLRKALQPGVTAEQAIQTRPNGYVLAVDPDQVDALRFRRLIGDSRGATACQRSSELAEALALWRGPALADFTYEPFAQAEITSLDELRLLAIEDRLEAELELGRAGEVVQDAVRLAEEHPFRERLRGLAMLALYMAGNQQRALEVYRRGYDVMTEELGIEPGEALQELEVAILNHDPSLSQKRIGWLTATATSEAPASTELLSEKRHLVTVMFVDFALAPSPDSDPEALRGTARRGSAIITETIRRHGGSSQGSIGGINVAVFGIPEAHEDDASRAARAAFAITAEMENLRQPRHGGPTVRIGINTGEVVMGDASFADLGHPDDTVRVAARLQQSAKPGQVLIGEATRRLLDGAATVERLPGALDDQPGPAVSAWKLVTVPPIARGGDSDTPWVGRRVELSSLAEALELATARDTAIGRLIIGAAGVGKSRLVTEFTRSMPVGTRSLVGHCPPYGEGSTFWPLQQMVHQTAGDVDKDAIHRLVAAAPDGPAIAEQITAFMGSIEAAPRPDQVFPVVRAFFGALAESGPVVLVVEDLHWAQPTFLDLIEYLTGYLSAPVLILGTARPEFLDLRPDWLGHQRESGGIRLGPLSPEEVAGIVHHHVERYRLSPEHARTATKVAGGNPLFIEQILAELRESGEVTIPPSLLALLHARLDRLGPAEAVLIRAASVLGPRFLLGEVLELLPEEARPSAERLMDTLLRRELLDGAPGDETFAFRHDLIQRATYQTITKADRSRLHETAADLIENRSRGDQEGTLELIGYHLERAFAYRAELGVDDEHTRRLAARAGRHLSKAGLRAFDRLDVTGALNLLDRAVRLLPGDDPDRWQAKRYLAEARQMMGQHQEAMEAFGELIDHAERRGDATLAAFFELERLWAIVATGPDPITLDEIEDETKRARETFEADGDETGLSQVERLEWILHHRRGQVDEMERAAQREIEHARRSTSSREAVAAAWLMALTLKDGPRPVRECIETCEGLVAWTDSDNPGVLSILGALWAMAGDFPLARELAAQADRLFRERIRARRPLGQVIWTAAEVELLAGEHQAGIAKLTDALDRNLAMGENEMICQIAATLARVLAHDGEIGRAEALAGTSRDRAPIESVVSQALWRSAVGLVLSERGEDAPAIELVSKAVELAPVGMLNLKAEVTADLGRVLFRAGERDLALEAFSEATELFERKGNAARVGSLRLAMDATSQVL